jgi:hypothetical protein
MPPTRPPTGEHAEENRLVESNEGGNFARRQAWMARRRGLGPRTAEVLARASEARATEEMFLRSAVAGPPGTVNWTPLGPSAVAFGQAFGRPVVSGRVLGIAVAPGATRAYAGVADGGIWRWTRDTTHAPPAELWEPQDDFVQGIATPGASANSMSVGDIAVSFGADPKDDLIFVGTGEAHTNPVGPGRQILPDLGRDYLGVGIRVSPPHAAAAPRVWAIEAAAALANQATFRLTLDPDDATRVFAATTAGLFRRPAGGAAVWPQEIGTPPNVLPAGLCTDVKVNGTAAAKRVWAAFDDLGVFQTTDNGVNWAPIPGLPLAPAPGRISLAVDESPGAAPILYALTELGQLFRFDAQLDTRFRRVTRLPGAATLNSGFGNYVLAVAVAPGLAGDRVFIGGAVVQSNPTSDFEWELSGYRSDLTSTSPTAFRFNFNAANNSGVLASRDSTYIGRGVHGDAHCITFGRDAAGNLDPTDVWIGSDGGVYRSTSGGDNGTFVSLNTGLATIQFTYFDQHPVHESVLLGGCQDNGVMRSIGHPTWLEDPKGDGGGCAIDQTNPFRMMAQTAANDFFVSVNAGVEWRRFALPIAFTESVDFYTQICSAPPAGGPPPPVPTPNPGWALVPTDRVWATHDWGTTWVTLPRATTPAPGNAAQDVVDGSRVVALVWPLPNRFYAATQLGVFRFDFNAATGRWARVALGGPPGVALGGPEINDLTVVNPAVGVDELYVCISGAGFEHVWWFDTPTGWLSTNSLPTFDTPAEAIVVDPGNPLQVWVGTDVGVFQGTHAPPAGGAPRAFAWALQSQGLPESAVTDLRAVVGSPLLRVTTHGRGAWERPVAGGVGLDPDLYLRMNPADNGRRLPTAAATVDPTRIRRDNLTTINVDWGDSPDLKVRRGIEAQPAPAFPGRLRLQAPRLINADVERWQRHAIRRGFDLTPGLDDREFGPTSERAARELQRRYGLVVWRNGQVTDGIVGEATWTATVSYPPLPARLDHRLFVTDVREDYDETSGLLIADATGPNRVFLLLHSRGSLTVAPTDVRALLLLARPDGAGNPPNLPAGWDGRIQAGDTSIWAGPNWLFADPAGPYRSPVVRLTARDPQVVEWSVDFSTRGFAPGETVIMLAFLTTVPGSATPDLLANPEVRVRQLVTSERRVAARRVRLDAVTVIA